MKDQGKGHRAGRASALFLLGSVAVAACHPTRAEYDEEGPSVVDRKLP